MPRPTNEEYATKRERQRVNERRSREAHREDPEWQERKRRDDAQYRERHREVRNEQKRATHLASAAAVNAVKREKYSANPASAKAYADRYRRMNPERARLAHRASQMIYRALKRGLLVRPTQCTTCGDGGGIEAAHANYTRPLDVRWLCRPCHRRWDAAMPKTMGAVRG